MIHSPNGQLLSTLKSSHARHVNLGGHDEICRKNRAAVCGKNLPGMMWWFQIRSISPMIFDVFWNKLSRRLAIGVTNPCVQKFFFFSVDKLREQHLSTCLVCWVCQAQNVENQSIYLLNWAGNILGCCSAPSRNARPRQVLQLQHHLPDNRHIFFSVSGIVFFSLQPWLGWEARKNVSVPSNFWLEKMEDGNMAPTAHMWWSTIGTFLCWKDQSLKAAMSGWCPAIVTPLTELTQTSLNATVDLRISRSWHRRRGHDASWGVQCSTKCRSVFWAWPRIQRDPQRRNGICELNSLEWSIWQMCQFEWERIVI